MQKNTLKRSLLVLWTVLALCVSSYLPRMAFAQATPPAPLSYNKYLISPAIQRIFSPDEKLYRRVFDALDQQQQDVDLSDFSPTQEQVDAVITALFDRFEFVMLRGADYDPQTSKLHLDTKTSGEEARAQVQAFRDKVTYLLENVLAPEQTEVERVMALHQYFASTTQYSADAEDVGPYGVMVKEQGLCTGYAYAMAYMLDQLGIENHLTNTDDGVHIFNTVLLDGKYYHMDATYESCSSDGAAFFYFGMTDEQARGNYGAYTSGNPNYGAYPTPECSDNRFSYLRSFPTAQLYTPEHALYYTDMEQDNKLFRMDLRTNARTVVLDEPVMSLRLFQNQLFYQTMAQATELYRMDLNGQNAQKLNTGISVTRMRFINGELWLYDDIHSQQKAYEKP
ncbi:MAG: DUF5050 domain-containing protein [Clostridia bacterium]